MEESGDLGAREGGRRPKNVSMLRIDHSDVYLENERLNENLLYSIDSLHRSRYRKVLSRDTEINEVRQSLQRLRQSNTGSVLKRANNPRLRKAKSEVKPTSEDARNGNVRKNKKGSDDNHNERNISTPTTVKSIQVRMPRTHKGDDDSDDTSSYDSDDVGDNDDTSDDEEKEKSINISHLTSYSSHGNLPTRPGFKPDLMPPESYTQTTKKGQNRNDLLKRLMSRLKIDQIPPSWYTDVIPASDVPIPKLVLLRDEKKKKRPGTQNTRGPRSRQQLIARPATSGTHLRQGGQSPQNQQKQLRQRPLTSIGISRREEVKTNPSPDKHSNVNNGKELDRPSTVLVCGRQNASKTLRQLKEEELQATLVKTHTAVDILLEEAKEERKTIDEKVKLFVKSLEERKRSERLRNMLTTSMLLDCREAMSWQLS